MHGGRLTENFMVLHEIILSCNKGLWDLIWKGRLLVQKNLEAFYLVRYTLLFSVHETLLETDYFHLHGLRLGSGHCFVPCIPLSFRI